MPDNTAPPDPAPDKPRAPRRRWLWALASIAGLLLAACIAAWFLIARIDLAPLAASRLTASLGRKVTIAALHVTPGSWLHIELQSLSIENLEGGTRPAMAEVAGITAELEARSLLQGQIVLRHMAIDGLDVLLEHVPGLGPNWHFSPRKPNQPRPRGSIPTILDARVVGDVLFRTSRGTPLPIQLDGVTLTAADPAQPVHLAGPGSYRGVPILLDATLGTYRQYRDTATPFPTDIHLVSGDTKLRFDGTMTAPLDLDGARGHLTLEAPTPAVIYRVLGTEAAFDPAIRLEGQLTHDQQNWELTEAKGALATSEIESGTLHLEEGRVDDGPPLSREPDKIAATLDFAALDLDALLGDRQTRSGADLSLKVDKAPETLLDAKLTAKTLIYGGTKLTEIQFAGVQEPGRIAVDALALTYLGGKIEAKGEVLAADEGGRVSGDVSIANMQVAALRSVLGMTRLPLEGALNGRASLTATGPSLNAATRAMRAAAVLTMTGGSVAKEVIEMASTDVRTLFRTAKGMTPISCALGVMDVRAGIGTISPLRLRTADGTVTARGTIDLIRHRVDLTVASEGRTTSLFALDVPVRVYGPFTDVTFTPAKLSPAGRAQIAGTDVVPRLLPTLQTTARNSPCL